MSNTRSTPSVLVQGACSLLLASSFALAGNLNFQVPAGDLKSALNLYVKQTGIQLVYRENDVRGVKTAGVRGELTPEAALTRILAGTPLVVHRDASGAIAIAQPDNAPQKSTAVAMPVDAQLMYLAQVQDSAVAAEAESKAQGKTGKSGDDVEEMIVEENRIKPFTDKNVDIPRTINDSQPYYIFDSETIERSAAVNVEDFLKQRLTMNATSQTFSQMTSAAGPGTPQPAPNLNGSTSAINLRGMGADKTLVLVNGRRMAYSSLSMATASASLTSGQADLNGIPLSAIERIEVLPSSSSGIYGGSALGGVVNVVLKKNYSGGEARASYDNTPDTNAPRRTVSLSYGTGFNGGRTRLMLNASWNDSEAMLLQDRRELLDRGLATIFRNNRSFLYSNTFLGSLPNVQASYDIIYNPDGSWNTFINAPSVLTLKDGRSLGSNMTYIPAGTSASTPFNTLASALLANAGQWNFDLPSTAQNPTGLGRQMGRSTGMKSLMLSARHEFTNSLEVTLDLTRNENDSLLIMPPNSVDNIHVGSASPFNPFNSGVNITLPNTLVYDAPSNSRTDSATIGATLKLPRNWMVQADYTWSRNTHTAAGALVDGMLSERFDRLAVFNPFVDMVANPFDMTDYIVLATYDYKTDFSTLALRGSGPLPSLPWGVPSLTMGLEHRAAKVPENTRVRVYEFSVASSSTQTTFAREQGADSLYAETLIPLVARNRFPLLYSMDLQASGRMERYLVDTGTPSYTVNTLTGAISYTAPTRSGQPFFDKDSYVSTNSTFGLKYQPVSSVTLRTSLATAFLPPTPAQLLKNPLINPGFTNVTDPTKNNAPAQVQTISGGNPNLTPQNSKSFNAGLILEPTAGVLKNMRFNVEYYRIKQSDVIGGLSAQQILNDEKNFSDRVVRNAAGNVTFIDTSSLNLYGRETEGMDISVDYSRRTSIGNFGVHAVGSQILGLKEQYSLSLPEYDTVGFPSEGGAAKYKANLQLTWDYHNWTAAWSTVYFGSYKQYGALGGRSATQTRATNPNAALDTTYISAQGSDTIPSQLYHDIYLGYAFDKNTNSALFSGVAIQLGMRNVFNTLPPVDLYYDYYISPYGDTRLRSYWLSLKKAF